MPDIVIQPVNPINVTISPVVNQVNPEDSAKLKFTWRGSWQPSVTYSREDVVRYLGNAYICLVTHTSGAMIDLNNWEVMVEGSASANDIFYQHIQSVASSDWVIQHNLGKYPSVTVVDSSGDECEGQVNYTSSNQLTISFSAPFSGVAYLN